MSKDINIIKTGSRTLILISVLCCALGGLFIYIGVEGFLNDSITIHFGGQSKVGRYVTYNQNNDDYLIVVVGHVIIGFLVLLAGCFFACLKLFLPLNKYDELVAKLGKVGGTAEETRNLDCRCEPRSVSHE